MITGFKTDDFQYYLSARIGGQGPFRLVVDTGSANVWVPGAQCGTPACEGRARLSRSVPGAFQANGGPDVQITYGDTFIQGAPGRAPIALAGAWSNASAAAAGNASDALAFTQGVVVAASVAGGPAAGPSGQAPWDGLLGMGRAALAVGWMQPPLASLAEQGLLPAPVFGLWLSHDPRGGGRGGELALGGWNAARTQGEVHWVPVVSSPDGQQGFWSVPLDAIVLSGGALPAPRAVLCGNASAAPGGGESGGGCVGALDSGTALLTGTVRQVGALNRALGFAPGAFPLAGGAAGCGAEAARLTSLISGAGREDPGSEQLAGICQRLGAGALSPEATLCAAALSNIDAARAALQGGRGAPAAATLDAARNATAADCELLPYCFNATLPCTEVEALPNVSFVIGGAAYNVTPLQYAALGPDSQCYSLISCLGSLPANFWILGDTLMHNIYTVYDSGHNGGPPRVGFAALAPAEEELRRELDALLEGPIATFEHPHSAAAPRRAARGWVGLAAAAAAAAAAVLA
ncbi:MAG: aspartic peptidase domain-containing protein [Monoraphidium minutum]|nr:MAG: aspartic peptidase domain-containing protein [Monoraphidium minutum]